MKYCTKYFNISPNLVKKLIKDENVTLLDIIFSHFKFYDNAFIMNFLLDNYKNKIAISTSNLNQKITNEKFQISINVDYSFNNIGKYLINECSKKDINIYIIKYLVEHGVDINETNDS
eukprot:jgi/Orpsp1_1/1186897/evm.model.d7180000053948.1